MGAVEVLNDLVAQEGEEVLNDLVGAVASVAVVMAQGVVASVGKVDSVPTMEAVDSIVHGVTVVVSRVEVEVAMVARAVAEASMVAHVTGSAVRAVEALAGAMVAQGVADLDPDRHAHPGFNKSDLVSVLVSALNGIS